MFFFPFVVGFLTGEDVFLLFGIVVFLRDVAVGFIFSASYTTIELSFATALLVKPYMKSERCFSGTVFTTFSSVPHIAFPF